MFDVTYRKQEVEIWRRILASRTIYLEGDMCLVDYFVIFIFLVNWDGFFQCRMSNVECWT